HTVFTDGLRSARSFAIILIVHLAVIVLWQVLVDAFQVPKFILPSPLATVATLSSAKYAWLSNFAVTAAEILGRFCLGGLVGVMLAVTFTWSPLVSLLLLPLFVTLNMIPKVALGPLFIVWFSYGIFPNILIAFSICFFPILLTTARGLSEVEPDLLDLVKSLRGSRWTLFRKIQLPGSLPYIFSGMKVGAILAVAGDTEVLDELLCRPTQALIDDLARVDGDILILGVAGKMGPTLAGLAKAASPDCRVIGVARFSEPGTEQWLRARGIETIHCDLLD